MIPLVECVPNFSEGRDLKVIQSIEDAISEVAGVKILDVDTGWSANRTVITFIGFAEDILEAGFRAYKAASSLIDMRAHRGNHPRFGAIDVFPLIPLKNVSMQDCINLSHTLAKRVGEELSIPVYLYRNSATSSERQSLAYLRRGQYEQLGKRMLHQSFVPDYGPKIFNESAGVTAIGARPILIAYNVNLATNSIEVARNIALAIRHKRDLQKLSRSDQEKSLQDLTALGWYVEEYNCAQVSMNILNYTNTSLFDAYELVNNLALEHKTRVTGSEIVGLVPLSAILDAGHKVEQKERMVKESSEKELVENAVSYLNLADKKTFDPARKILEYRLARETLRINE